MHTSGIIKCLVISLVLLSCKPEEKKPELISPQLLSYVLIDMHMLDGIVDAYNTNNKEKIRLSKDFYDSVIFLKHGTNDSLFRQSIEYYTMHGEIEEIYAMVLDSLNTQSVIIESGRQRKTPTQSEPE
jgi:hypothetical protein